MRTKKSNIHKENYIKRLFYFNMAASFLSSMLVFLAYNVIPDSELIHVVLEWTQGWSAIESRHHLAMSLFMSAFLKTAPVFGIVWFMLSIGKVGLTGNGDLKKMLISSVFFPLFYLVIVCFLIKTTHNITDSGRYIKYISRNEHLLFFYFAFIHLFISMLTYFLFLFPNVTYLQYRKGKGV